MRTCSECGWLEPCDCEPERSAGSLERVVLPPVTSEERARCKLITAANAIADGRHVDAYMEAQSALVDIAQGKNAADAKRQNDKLSDAGGQSASASKKDLARPHSLQ